MFLNKLEKEEKVAFLELAHYVARIDSDFSLSQKDIINNYCMEMQIEDISFDVEKFDIHNTLGKITNKKNQKIILLEIMALIYSDNYLHIEEKKIIDIIVEQYDLNKALSVVYSEWAKSILALYIQGNALIEL